ncbi:MAG TPA: NADPH-dependent FMN reductase, partial [Alphaproteobacteria bacterium]|nr:NADPH-dependent FMN reductase [Alphaproteobacteria bacterium]
MTTIVGISGSLRKGSFNTSLLRAAAKLVPEDVTLTVETIRGVPLYDADEESANGVPKRVEELKDAVAAADGLLIVT